MKLFNIKSLMRNLRVWSCLSEYVDKNSVAQKVR